MNDFIDSKQIKVLHKTYTIKIFQDDSPISPERATILAQLLLASCNYDLGEINGAQREY